MISTGPQGAYGEGIPRARKSGGFAEHFRAPGVTEEKKEEVKHIEGPWGDRPSVARQMTDFPNTCRRKGADQYAYFELPRQLEDLNKFMRQTFPIDSPLVQLLARHENPTPSGMNVTLRYFQYEYMNISPSASLQRPPAAAS